MNAKHYKSFCTTTTYAAAKKLGLSGKKNKILSSVFTVAAVTAVNYGLHDIFMQEASHAQAAVKSIKGSALGLLFAQTARYLIAKNLYARPPHMRVDNSTGTSAVILGQGTGYIAGNIVSYIAL